MLLTILLFLFKIAMPPCLAPSHAAMAAFSLVLQHLAQAVPAMFALARSGYQARHGGMLSSGASAPLSLIYKSHLSMNVQLASKPKFYKAAGTAPDHGGIAPCSAARKRGASSHKHLTNPHLHHGAKIEMHEPCEAIACFFARLCQKNFCVRKPNRLSAQNQHIMPVSSPRLVGIFADVCHTTRLVPLVFLTQLVAFLA